MIEDNILTNS